ncbi:unnamed protein product [Closterium sp. NIES-53]
MATDALALVAAALAEARSQPCSGPPRRWLGAKLPPALPRAACAIPPQTFRWTQRQPLHLPRPGLHPAPLQPPSQTQLPVPVVQPSPPPPPVPSPPPPLPLSQPPPVLPDPPPPPLLSEENSSRSPPSCLGTFPWESLLPAARETPHAQPPRQHWKDVPPAMSQQEQEEAVAAAMEMLPMLPTIGLVSGSPRSALGPGPASLRRLALAALQAPWDIVPAAASVLRWMDGRLCWILAE